MTGRNTKKRGPTAAAVLNTAAAAVHYCYCHPSYSTAADAILFAWFTMANEK